MINGKFDFKNSFDKEFIISLSKPYFNSHDLKIHYFDCFNFSGSLLINSTFPYTTEDYIYLNKEKDLLTLLDGKIYNQQELTSKYNLRGKVKTPELLCFMFLTEGPEFVRDLNGDFFISIIDHRKNEFYFFRDHLGIIPFAYLLNENFCCISTDVTNLCRYYIEDSKINLEPLMSEFRFADLTQTLNNKITKLLPGHYLRYKNNKVTLKKYWKPEKIKTDKNLKLYQAIKDLNLLVVDSVHIRSDNRLIASAHISGGLDSSVVASLSRKEYSHQEKFYGYSWSPPFFASKKLDYDERILVEKTCFMNNMSCLFVELESEEYKKYAKDYINNFGFFQEDKVLRHAKSNRVNLIFSGWGGDEFISKGDRGILSDLIFKFKWLMIYRKFNKTHLRGFIKLILFQVLLPAFNILTISQRRIYSERTKYFKKPWNKHNYKSLKYMLFYKSRRELHLGLLYDYHISFRTEIWYRNGFLNSVEYRYPLLDKRIIEYMLRIPSKILFGGNNDRILIREIAKGLIPEEVRLVSKGSDPVLFSYCKENINKIAFDLIFEINDFKKNPDLYFVDFQKLEKDASTYQGGIQVDYFAYNILTIKLFHEFTKRYRNNYLSMEQFNETKLKNY